MLPKKAKVNPADQFIEYAAPIAAAVDAVAPEVSTAAKDDIKTRRITVRINEELFNKLWAARAASERSMDAIVTAALERYLGRSDMERRAVKTWVDYVLYFYGGKRYGLLLLSGDPTGPVIIAETDEDAIRQAVEIVKEKR